MLHHRLIAVGRMKKGAERTLFEHYAARLRPALDLREVEEKRPLASHELKQREAELLLNEVPSGAKLVALDERGKSLDSRSLAGQIDAWRDIGVPSICWLIGGADGHGDNVRQQADLLLSFGKMTWPHMLVRGMLAEQIYRTQQISAGHPYHRD